MLPQAPEPGNVPAIPHWRTRRNEAHVDLRPRARDGRRVCPSLLPAQQTTGTPGSPSATTTIDGRYLPAPPQPFTGVINLDAQHSTPGWPARVVPPKGAPNILLIMTDDQGYGVTGTFGGVIPTPTMDRIAKIGTALHAVPLHGALLAHPRGADHRSQPPLGRLRRHRRTVDRLSGLQLRHRPGERDDRRDPEGQRLRHVLVREEPQYAHLPVQRRRSVRPVAHRHGFQYFYGFMGGETDQWTPYLFRNTTAVYPWVGKPGYNLMTDMADEAIAHIQRLNAVSPDQPFFVYYVPGATHSPHQPKPEWIAKFKGKFDMGWNALRDTIFANQKRLGVIPANAQLTPWPDALPRWETLPAENKRLFAHQAEVFAGYAAYADYEIGRVVDAVERLGKLDNTLIIYISGDNGTSAEGTLVGTPNQMTAYNAHPRHSDRRPDEVLRRVGIRPAPTLTCRWPGRGLSTRRSSGPSRSPRSSVAPDRAWSCPGPGTSRIPAASGRSFTT